jgi:phage terminase large subunit
MNENKVIFSEKYKPLFEILQAWEINKEFPKNEYYAKLSKVDTVILTGSRDSGKTFSLSSWVGIASHDYNHRILYTRQTMSSTDNSISAALNERLELLGIESGFRYANNTYTCLNSDGKITITGQKTSVGTQTAKLKSIEDYSVFITDEADEMPNFEDWQKVKRSIRAKDVQCLAILALNPSDKEHWIFTTFFENVPEGFNGIIENVLYIHTDYLDNGKDNMALHNWSEYESLRLDYEYYFSLETKQREFCDPIIKKRALKYKHECLGHWRNRAEGLIYEDWITGEFPEHLPSVHGLDFGSNDPDALTEIVVDENKKKIYIREKYFQNNTSFDGLSQVLSDRVGWTNLIVADNAERRLIKDYFNMGFNIRKCYKGKVKDEIQKIQDYQLIVCPKSINLQKALNNYRWHDKKSGLPNHDWSDLCDSFRYAAMYVIRGQSTSIEW